MTKRILYVLQDNEGVIHLLKDRWQHPEWEFLGVLRTEFDTD
jgi:hypothetical protein